MFPLLPSGQLTSDIVKPSSDANNTKYVFGTPSKADKNIPLIETIPKSTQTSPFDDSKEIQNTSFFGAQQQSDKTSLFGQSNTTFGTSKPMDCGSKIDTQPAFGESTIRRTKNTPIFEIQYQNSQKSLFGHSNIVIGTSEPMDSSSKTTTQAGFGGIQNTSLFGAQQQSGQTSFFGQSNTSFGTSKPIDCSSKPSTQQQNTQTSPFDDSKIAFGTSKPMDSSSKTTTITGFSVIQNTSLFGAQQQSGQTSFFGTSKSIDCGSKSNTQQQSTKTSPFGHSKEAFGSAKPTGFDLETNKQAVFGNSGFSQPSATAFNIANFSGSLYENGTMYIKYNPSIVPDNITEKTTKHQCITSMKEYEGKSLEELRLQDYLINSKWPYVGSTNNLINSPKSVSRDDYEPRKALFKQTRKSISSHTTADMNKKTNATVFNQNNQFSLSPFSKPSEFCSFVQTAPIFGNIQSLFGKTTLDSAPGTAFIKYQPLIVTENSAVNGVYGNFTTKQHCITAMTQYSGKSFEELRLEDYLFNKELHWKGVGKNLDLFNGSRPENRFDCPTGFTGYPQITINRTPNMFGQQNQTLKIDFGGGISFNVQKIPQTNFNSFGQSSSNVLGFEIPQISLSQTPNMFGQQNQTVKIDFGGGISFNVQKIQQASGLFGQSDSNVLGFESPKISFSQTPIMFGQQKETVKIDFGGISLNVQKIQQASGLFGKSDSNVLGFESPQISFSQTPNMFGQQNQNLKIDFGAGISFLVQQIPQTNFNSFGQSNSNVLGFGYPQIFFSQTPNMFGQQNQNLKIDFGAASSFFIQQVPQTKSFTCGNTNTSPNRLNLGSFTSNNDFGSFGLNTNKSVYGFGQTNTSGFGSTGNKFEVGQTFGTKNTFGNSNNFQTQPTIPLESVYGFGQTNTSGFGSTGNKVEVGQTFGTKNTFGNSNNFQTQPTIPLESVYGFGQTNTSGFGSTGNKVEVGQTFGTKNTFGNSNNFQTQPTIPLESGFGFGQTNTSGCFGSTANKIGVGQTFGTKNTFGNSNNFQTQPTIPLESGFGFGQTNTSGCFGSTANKFEAGQTFGTKNTFGNSNNFQTQPTIPLESGFGFGQTNTSGFGSTGNKIGVGQTFGTKNTFGNSNNFQTQPTIPLESGFGFGQKNTSGCFGSIGNKFEVGQTFGTKNTFGGFQQQSAFSNRQPNVTLKISPDGIEIINFQLI